MKYWIIGIMVVAIIVASYWAGTQSRDKKDSEETQEPTASVSGTVNPATSTPRETTQPTGDSSTVGNRPGNKAPDFRLKDSNGNFVSLRDYLGREEVTLSFTSAERLTIQGKTLLDPGDVVHRLYGVTTMPRTFVIDINGIIK